MTKLGDLTTKEIYDGITIVLLVIFSFVFIVAAILKLLDGLIIESEIAGVVALLTLVTALLFSIIFRLDEIDARLP